MVGAGPGVTPDGTHRIEIASNRHFDAESALVDLHTGKILLQMPLWAYGLTALNR